MAGSNPGLITRAAHALRGAFALDRSRSEGFSMGEGRRFLPPYLAASQRSSVPMVADLGLFDAVKFFRPCQRLVRHQYRNDNWIRSLVNKTGELMISTGPVPVSKYPELDDLWCAASHQFDARGVKADSAVQFNRQPAVYVAGAPFAEGTPGPGAISLIIRASANYAPLHATRTIDDVGFITTLADLVQAINGGPWLDADGQAVSGPVTASAADGRLVLRGIHGGWAYSVGSNGSPDALLAWSGILSPTLAVPPIFAAVTDQVYDETTGTSLKVSLAADRDRLGPPKRVVYPNYVQAPDFYQAPSDDTYVQFLYGRAQKGVMIPAGTPIEQACDRLGIAAGAPTGDLRFARDGGDGWISLVVSALFSFGPMDPAHRAFLGFTGSPDTFDIAGFEGRPIGTDQVVHRGQALDQVLSAPVALQSAVPGLAATTVEDAVHEIAAVAQSAQAAVQGVQADRVSISQPWSVAGVGLFTPPAEEISASVLVAGYANVALSILPTDTAQDFYDRANASIASYGLLDPTRTGYGNKDGFSGVGPGGIVVYVSSIQTFDFTGTDPAALAAMGLSPAIHTPTQVSLALASSNVEFGGKPLSAGLDSMKARLDAIEAYIAAHP